MNFLGMGPLELVVIGALALIFVGPSKLPDLARQFGRLVGELRRVTSDVRAEFRQNLQLNDPPKHTPVIRPNPPPPPPVQHPPSTDDLRPPY